MTSEEFKRRHAPSWTRLERMLDVLDAGASKPLHEEELAEFDRLYRLVCKHLALARLRVYGADLVEYLNRLALRAHHRFYGGRTGYWRRIASYLVVDFPRQVRIEWRPVLVAALLFVLPATAVATAVRLDPDFIHQVLAPEEVRDIEHMYDPSGKYRTEERAAATDTQMFGFYIWNNISVAFQAFAGGIVLGLRSIYILIFNGVFLGAVAVHLIQHGMSSTFLSFVAGHSAPELTAIVLAGAAGIKIGWAMLVPGRHTRSEALRLAARSAITIVAGAAAMLVLAALIEGYWSPSRWVPNGVKYAVGCTMWVLVPLYLVLSGRHRGS